MFTLSQSSYIAPHHHLRISGYFFFSLTEKTQFVLSFFFFCVHFYSLSVFSVSIHLLFEIFIYSDYVGNLRFLIFFTSNLECNDVFYSPWQRGSI